MDTCSNYKHSSNTSLQALHAYAKALAHDENAAPVLIEDIEKALREENANFFLVAVEREVSDVMTIVNFQGKIDCKYQLQPHFSLEPRRVAFAQFWPKTAEENMERLKESGFIMDRGVPKCDNCGGKSLCPLSALRFSSKYYQSATSDSE